MMNFIPSVIVVFPTTATNLRDEYQLPTERVWGLTQHGDARYEALEPARVRPDVNGNTWGYPAPGVSKKQWKPPLDLHPK